MANADRPNGFAPRGKVLRTTEYTAGSTISPGDAVKKSSDGKIDPVDTAGASYTSAVLGVALSSATDGNPVYVSDHPDQEYSCQADGADIDAQTDIGLNYAILATSRDSTYDVSRMELDSSTGNTTNTLPLMLMRVEPTVGNALGAQVNCIVRINNNQLVADGGATGV